MVVSGSRKKCNVADAEIASFLSLSDYRNNYFTSSDPNKIIEFYNLFKNREQLIKWMKERPKGATNIYETEGNKDIIVVIPTSDFNGKYSKECRENIFKGLHIIFVQSGEIPDPYFNYAHSCNVGIKKAMEYNPKWVVVSNDDMYRIDSISELINKLSNLNNKEVNIVYANSPNFNLRKVLLVKQVNLIHFYFNLFNIGGFRMLERVTRNNGLNLYYEEIRANRLISHLFKHAYYFNNFECFGIFSSYFIQKQRDGLLFDETFINGREDIDLSLKLSFQKEKIKCIDYKIGNHIGSSLGNGLTRSLRHHAGRVYLYYKWTDEIDALIN